MNGMLLQRGDIVDLIAPSSGLSEDEYNSCLKIIEDFGLTPRAKPYAELVDSSFAFVSNSAEVRFAHLEEALKNAESKAVWCIAGGNGSYHLLSMLDKVPAPTRQKMLIGFSDNTAVLSYAISKWNWSAIYGLGLRQIVRGQVSDSAVESIKRLIFEGPQTEVTPLSPLNKACQKEGPLAGKMIGGCLSLMQVFLGTPQCPDVQGKILLLEDDKYETPGRVDRIFDHMIRAGFFDGARAVVLGSFLEEDYKAQEQGFLQAVKRLGDHLDTKNIPLLKAEHVGHDRDMISVPLGTFINIKLGENPVLKFGI